MQEYEVQQQAPLCGVTPSLPGLVSGPRLTVAQHGYMGSIPVATVATTSVGRSRNRIGNIGIGGMSDGRVAEHGVGGRIDGTFSEHITIGGMAVFTIATHNIAGQIGREERRHSKGWWRQQRRHQLVLASAGSPSTSASEA